MDGKSLFLPTPEARRAMAVKGRKAAVAVDYKPSNTFQPVSDEVAQSLRVDSTVGQRVTSATGNPNYEPLLNDSQNHVGAAKAERPMNLAMQNRRCTMSSRSSGGYSSSIASGAGKTGLVSTTADTDSTVREGSTVIASSPPTPHAAPKSTQKYHPGPDPSATAGNHVSTMDPDATAANFAGVTATQQPTATMPNHASIGVTSLEATNVNHAGNISTDYPHQQMDINQSVTEANHAGFSMNEGNAAGNMTAIAAVPAPRQQQQQQLSGHLPPQHFHQSVPFQQQQQVPQPSLQPLPQQGQVSGNAAMGQVNPPPASILPQGLQSLYQPAVAVVQPQLQVPPAPQVQQSYLPPQMQSPSPYQLQSPYQQFPAPNPVQGLPAFPAPPATITQLTHTADETVANNANANSTVQFDTTYFHSGGNTNTPQ